MKGLSQRKIGESVGSWALLMFFVAWSTIPVFYIAVSSFKLPTDIWAYPPRLIAPMTTANYRLLFTRYPAVLRHLGNSVTTTLGSVALTIVLAFFAAFAFSRHRSRLLRLPAIFLIAIRMFPPIVITIPLFPVFNFLNLLDRQFTVMLMLTVFSVSMATWLLKSFIDEVPIELEESAQIDGCSAVRAFFSITIPLTAPGIFAVTVFVGVAAWNDYLFSFLFATNRARTIPPLIAQLMDSMMGVEWGALLALCMVHLVPMLVLIMMVQKNLIKGLSSGAVKG